MEERGEEKANKIELIFEKIFFVLFLLKLKIIFFCLYAIDVIDKGLLSRRGKLLKFFLIKTCI